MQSNRVLGVLKGQDFPVDQLLAWARSAEITYAADGAAKALLDAGLKPIVVGDMDSLDPSSVPPDVRLVKDPDQDTTDCDKLLALASADGIETLTLIGIEGDRLDHMMSTLSSLVGRRRRIRLILRRATGFVVPCGESFDLPCPPGTRFSVIPLTLCWGLNLVNAKWPLHDAELRPGLHVSISNRSEEGCQVLLAGGTALVLIDRLLEEPPHWEE